MYVCMYVLRGQYSTSRRSLDFWMDSSPTYCGR